jgi:AbrB family looped-hinge helix DNA binding protein
MNTEISSRMTSKGQVTIPAAIRRLLGVKPSDSVAFVVEDRIVHVRRAESVITRTAGAVRGKKRSPTVKQLKEAAALAIATDTMRGLKR